MTKKDTRYYAKDYLKVLSHPFIKNLKLGKDMSTTRILVHKIEEILTGKEDSSISGSSFIDLEDIESNDDLFMLVLEMCDRLGNDTNREELESILKTIHDYFFKRWENITNFKEFASKIMQNLVIGDFSWVFFAYRLKQNYIKPKLKYSPTTLRDKIT